MTEPKRLDWKRMLSTALFLVLLALLIWYVYENRADMAKLLALSAGDVALLLTLALGGCVMNCVYHRLILSTYHIPLRVVDWMGVTFVANAMAYVLPMRADLVFSAAYYKRTKGLAYVKSVSMAAGNIVFGVVFALLQMFASLVLTGLIENVWSGTLWLLWGAATLAVGGFIAFSLLVQNRRLRILERVRVLGDVVRGFNDLIRNRGLLWRLLVCLIVNNAVQLCLYMACFAALGLSVTPYEALFYNSVSWIATVVSIVPGNIGIKEAVMGVAMSLTGALFQNGVAVSLLQRVAVMIVYVAAGAAFAWPVFRRWNRAEREA